MPMTMARAVDKVHRVVSDSSQAMSSDAYSSVGNNVRSS